MSIRRNTAYNLVGSLLPLAVSLVTIPLYVGLIGEARYGVLAIAWLLLGYFGLFDLGLGRATAQRIATLQGRTDGERAQTFWTALTLNVGLGAIGGLLVWPIAAYFFGHIFKIEDALRPEMQAAVLWLIIAVPMATLSGVLSGALEGRGRFLELNLISIFGTILFQLLPLAAAISLGVDLGILLPVALFARLLTLIMLFERCRRHIIFGHPPSFVRAQAKKLLRFGSWVTVTSFVGPMMTIFDRFIIGATTGAKAVTYYTVPFQLAQHSTIIPNALTSALFPHFATTTPQESQRLAYEALRALVCLMTPLVAAGILFIEPFLAWWIVPEFASQASRAGQVILLGFWINGLARIPFAQLQAGGRPDLVAKCHLGEVLPYFGALYLGLNAFGLFGAAMVFSLRVFVDFVMLAGFAGILKLSTRALLTPAILLLAAFSIATLSNSGQSVWIYLAGTHLVITLVWAWRQAPDSLRELALGHLKPLTVFSLKP